MKKPKAAAKSGGAFKCKCGQSYAYRKSFENHLYINEGDKNHAEKF